MKVLKSVRQADASDDAQPNLSARVYHSNLNLAHTTADLMGSDEIRSAYLAETQQYRIKIMIG